MTIDGYTDVPANNEEQLLKAVATQPVSVGIAGSGREFQFYSKVCLNDLNPIALGPTFDHYVC